MNLTNITEKLTCNKWLMDRKSLYSFYTSVENLARLRVGGFKGLLLGNSPLVSNVEHPSQDSTKTEKGNVSIITISGILTKGASPEEEDFLGLTNIDAISDALDSEASDPTTQAIVLNFASPGGEVCGIEELGRKIRFIDEHKVPVYGWTEKQSSSAAYWLMSQCSLIGMTPSAKVGSIGCYLLVLDMSEKYKTEGIKVQAISSGDFKLMGHDFKPLSDKEEAYLKEDVNRQHEKFKQTILSNRPKANVDTALSYEGSEALELGLVDVVTDSLEDFLSEIEL